MIKVGTYVQILDGSSRWHGVYGITHDFIGDIPCISCVSRPLEKYWVYPDLLNKIRICDEWN